MTFRHLLAPRCDFRKATHCTNRFSEGIQKIRVTHWWIKTPHRSSHTRPLPPPRSSASDVTPAPPPTQTQFFAFISFLPSFRAYFTSLLDTRNSRALALRREEKKWSAGNKPERALDPITQHQTHLKDWGTFALYCTKLSEAMRSYRLSLGSL